LDKRTASLLQVANLKDDREHSDYELYSAIDRETVEQAVKEARTFVAAIETYVQPWLGKR